MPGYVERQTTLTSTSQTYCSHLRSHHLIHQRRRYDKPTFERREEVHPTILGTFLYYGRTMDSTMLTALSSIVSTHAEPNKETMANIKLFLHYGASHQDAILTYQASDMVLIVHSNASYLSKPKARSRARGHFFMSSDVTNPHNKGA